MSSLSLRHADVDGELLAAAGDSFPCCPIRRELMSWKSPLGVCAGPKKVAEEGLL